MYIYCELTSHWQLMFPRDLAPSVFSKQPVEVSQWNAKMAMEAKEPGKTELQRVGLNTT